MNNKIFTLLYGDSDIKIDIISEDIKGKFKIKHSNAQNSIIYINLDESEFIKNPSHVFEKILNISFFPNAYFISIDNITNKSFSFLSSLIDEFFKLENIDFFQFILKTKSLTKNAKIKSLTTDPKTSKYFNLTSCYNNDDFSYNFLKQKLNEKYLKIDNKLTEYIWNKAEKKLENIYDFTSALDMYLSKSEVNAIDENIVDHLMSNVNSNYDIEQEIMHYLISKDYNKFYNILQYVIFENANSVLLIKTMTLILKKTIEINGLIQSGISQQEAVKKKVFFFNKIQLYSSIINKYNVKILNNLINKSLSLEFFVKNNQSNKNIVFSVIDYFFVKLLTFK